MGLFRDVAKGAIAGGMGGGGASGAAMGALRGAAGMRPKKRPGDTDTDVPGAGPIPDSDDAGLLEPKRPNGKRSNGKRS